MQASMLSKNFHYFPHNPKAMSEKGHEALHVASSSAVLPAPDGLAISISRVGQLPKAFPHAVIDVEGIKLQ